MARNRMKVVVDEVAFDGFYLHITNNRGVKYELDPKSIDWLYHDDIHIGPQRHKIENGTVLECDRKRDAFGRLLSVKFVKEV